jgi:V8-like Glu-specific endopeptidase
MYKVYLQQYGHTKMNRLDCIEPHKFKIGYVINTLPGHSGSPVIFEENIIALHSAAGVNNNIGRIMTFNLLGDLETWGK